MIELDLSKFTFGLYLKHYATFDKLNNADLNQPFKDTKHIEQWYAAMDDFTRAVSGWDIENIRQIKTPDRNSINKILADWMTFTEAELAQSYIEHGYDSFPLQVPFQSGSKTIDRIILEVPTVETSIHHDKAQPQLEKDWTIFRGMTELSDDEVKQLSMPDYLQVKRRAYDFLLESADYFPHRPSKR